MRGYPQQLVGQRFERLVVQRRVGRLPGRPLGKVFWECRCNCGQVRTICTQSLTNGHSRSCGCLKIEIFTQKSRLANTGEAGLRKLLDAYRRDAKRRGYQFMLSARAFKTLVQKPCYYCGAPPMHCRKPTVRQTSPQTVAFGTIFTNGVDRVDNARGYEPDNVVPCCGVCNRAKGVRGIEEFLAWARRIAACHSEEEGEEEAA